MLKLFILKIFVFLFVFSTNCSAEWKKITDGDNVEIFLDFKEIRKDNELIYFWQLNNCDKPLRKKSFQLKSISKLIVKRINLIL